MYLQYRNNRGTYELILANNRPDKDNELILEGYYLDKTPKYTEEGEEIAFVMPSREQLLKDCIFPDWQEGDILVIASQPLKYPKWSEEGQTLVEMTKEEICATGDLSVLQDGEKFENSKIVVVEKPNSKYLQYKWNRETYTWDIVTTKEELVTVRRNKITQVQQIKRDLQDLIDFGDSELEIAQLEEQKAILMQEIKELAELIKTM